MIRGIDASAVEAVRQVQAGPHSRNIVLEVARATDELREQVAQTGLTELIGPEPFSATVTAAVVACVVGPPAPKGPTASRRTQMVADGLRRTVHLSGFSGW